jgi:hypothetical protein
VNISVIDWYLNDGTPNILLKEVMKHIGEITYIDISMA